MNFFIIIIIKAETLSHNILKIKKSSSLDEKSGVKSTENQLFSDI